MKIIVIGSKGILGSAVAKALGAHGHEVVGASRTGDVKVDLEDRASVERLFASVKDIDAVISCAGEAAFKPLLALTDADYDLCIRSKMMGQVWLARIAVDHVKDGGSITLTTGILAQKPMPGGAAISLINSGLEGFVRAAALEMPRGLRVNAVSPPWIKETMVKLGMDPGPGLSADDCAKAYVAAVLGKHQGTILDATALAAGA
jgi:NAD(P)-dependent dehydrogenase (short-subunit alcohol dehydrogenase family)